MKSSMYILDHTQSTFLCLGKLLTDDQRSSITKGSIYYFKCMYIKLFSMEVDWPELWPLMDISTLFYICTYCSFYCAWQIACSLILCIHAYHHILVKFAIISHITAWTSLLKSHNALFTTLWNYKTQFDLSPLKLF